jgi:hypothetical protein
MHGGKMTIRVIASLFLLALTQLTPAYADWSLDDDDPAVLLLGDDENASWYLTFNCDPGGALSASYSVLAETLSAPVYKPPPEISVRLEIAPGEKKRQSFAVVANAQDGSSYEVGAADARALLQLVEANPSFVADLRMGNTIRWKARFGDDGFDELKDKIAAYCPPKP